jgi:hypothetical protein
LVEGHEGLRQVYFLYSPEGLNPKPQNFVQRSEYPVTTSRVGKDALSTRLAYYLKKLLASEMMELGVYSETFAAHLLIRGGVSAAWQSEVGRDLLTGLSRWNSDALDLYLPTGVDTKLTVTGRM